MKKACEAIHKKMIADFDPEKIADGRRKDMDLLKKKRKKKLT